jgi:flavorubredoxin
MGGKEFVRNQSKTKTVVMTVQKYGPVFVRSLEDSYEEAQHLSEFMVKDDDIDLFFKDPSYYTDKMEMWSAASFGQRGLEKYVSPLQKSQRALEKRETRLVVLITAKKGASAEQLAVLYSALSWTTSIYSRMLGHADYIAAHFEEDAAPVQLKPVQMPTLKKEHHVQAIPNQVLKLHTPSQDMRILKQGRVSTTKGPLVSRSV